MIDTLSGSLYYSDIMSKGDNKDQLIKARRGHKVHKQADDGARCGADLKRGWFEVSEDEVKEMGWPVCDKC